MLDRTGKQKIWRLQPGQIVRIELGNGVHSYGHVLKEPLVAFYDKPYEVQETSLDKISALPVAFALMVMTDAVTRGRWPIIGDVAIPPRLEVPPRFCKQDALTGDLSIYQEVPELAPHYERPAEVDECRGLETAAVWEPEHVEDRLRDHFAGYPNKWAEQLRPKLS